MVGAAECDDEFRELAHEVGFLLAEAGARLLTGGRSGVMAGASAGAFEGGGEPVGILPGIDESVSPPNSHVRLALFTGMGQARNQILVLSADVVIALGGGWGTLSEIAMALKYGIPTVLLRSWELARPDAKKEPLLEQATTAPEAVGLALSLGIRRRSQALS